MKLEIIEFILPSLEEKVETDQEVNQGKPLGNHQVNKSRGEGSYREDDGGCLTQFPRHDGT
jgi:hypothetical protein